MCNKYRNRATVHQLGKALDRQLAMPLVHFANEPFPEEVYPRRPGLVLRPAEPAAPLAGLEPFVAHWNLTPFFHRGGFKDWKASTNNCRSETMASSPAFREAVKRRRAIIPATSYVEWTGPKGAKTQHDISHLDGMLFIAGLWDRCGEGDSYTMVMMDAAGEAARFHDRMPVILDRDSARAWLDVEADWRDVLRPPPPGTLVADPPDPVTP